MDKTWLEVEIGESIDLLRDRLEIIDDMDADDMDCDNAYY